MTTSSTLIPETLGIAFGAGDAGYEVALELLAGLFFSAEEDSQSENGNGNGNGEDGREGGRENLQRDLKMGWRIRLLSKRRDR